MKKNSTGFTLIELLIYMSILAVISVMAITTIVIIIKAFGYTKIFRSLDDSARLAMERLSVEIRYASGVNVAASNLGSSPGKLVLNTTNRSTGATTTVEFSVNGSTLAVKEGSGSYQDLTGSGTLVTNLVFKRIAASSTSEAVKVEMTLSATNRGTTKVINYYDTVILRDSY